MFTTYKNIIRCNKAQAFKLINLPHRSLQEDCVGYDFALTTTKAIHQRYPITDQDRSTPMFLDQSQFPLLFQARLVFHPQ